MRTLEADPEVARTGSQLAHTRTARTQLWKIGQLGHMGIQERTKARQTLSRDPCFFKSKEIQRQFPQTAAQAAIQFACIQVSRYIFTAVLIYFKRERGKEREREREREKENEKRKERGQETM